MGMLQSLWAYRGFIHSSVRRDFHARYRNSLLGAVWAILNPLALIAVYTLIFSQVMRARLPGIEGTFGYSIYLCAGLLSWGYFAEVTTRGQNMFIENANLLKKMSFPRLCLPVIALATATVNFAIIFGLFCLFLLFLQIPVHFLLTHSRTLFFFSLFKCRQFFLISANAYKLLSFTFSDHFHFLMTYWTSCICDP